jgi:hypothetical protein
VGRYPKLLNNMIEHFQIANKDTYFQRPREVPAYLMREMCFYNQIIFSCGHWTWTCFVRQCVFGRNTGGTCGIKLVEAVENVDAICPRCDNANLISLRQNTNAEHQNQRENVEATWSEVITAADKATFETELFREI